MLLLCLLALSGCASTPVPLSEAIPAPADRVLAFQTPDPGKKAVLTVIRDSWVFGGGGCYYSFWINNQLAARMDNAEVARFYVEPGEIVMKMGRDPEGTLLCRTGQDLWVQRETTLKPGEEKVFRMIMRESSDIIRADAEQVQK